MRVHTSELSEFAPAERWALVRDGHAVVVDGIVCTIDTVPGAGLRLDALLCGDHTSTPHRDAVAIEQSALWVLGVIPAPPRQPCIAGLNGVRLYVGNSPAHVRELNIPSSDCLSFGNRLVTTPERTAADIARYTNDEQDAFTHLTALALRTEYRTRDALAIVGRTVHLPFARRARRRLGAALAHPVRVIDAIDAPNGVEETLKVARVAHFEDEPVEC